MPMLMCGLPTSSCLLEEANIWPSAKAKETVAVQVICPKSATISQPDHRPSVSILCAIMKHQPACVHAWLPSIDIFPGLGVLRTLSTVNLLIGS